MQKRAKPRDLGKRKHQNASLPMILNRHGKQKRYKYQDQLRHSRSDRLSHVQKVCSIHASQLEKGRISAEGSDRDRH